MNSFPAQRHRPFHFRNCPPAEGLDDIVLAAPRALESHTNVQLEDQLFRQHRLVASSASATSQHPGLQQCRRLLNVCSVLGLSDLEISRSAHLVQ